MKETKDIIESIKNIFPKDKKTTNLILIMLLLVIILIAMNYIFNEEDDKNNEVKTVVSDNTEAVNEQEVETRLENILNEINGVTNTKVMLSYSGTEKIIPVYDIKEDTSAESSDDTTNTKTVTEKTVAYEEQNGSKVAIVEKKETATINGAIVVATFENSKDIESKIKDAVSAVTNVPIYKIQVFSK